MGSSYSAGVFARVGLVLLGINAGGALAAESAPATRTDPANGGLTLHAATPVGYTINYLASWPHDAWETVTAPTRWDLRQWAEAAGIIGIGVALYAEDDHIAAGFQRRRSAKSDALARLVKPFGSTYLAVGLGGVGVASLFCDDPRLTRTTLLGAESLVFAGAGYVALQLLSDRSRPSQGADRDTWGGPHWHGGGHSFPSGHATAAFALASVVATQWRDTAGVPEVAYGLAALVALSRLNDDAHWATDVFTGAVLGWAAGEAVEHLHQPRDLTITPLIEGRREALAVRWRF